MRMLVLLCGMVLVAALTLGCHESGTSSAGPAPVAKAAVPTPAVPASAPASQAADKTAAGPASAPADLVGDQTPADHEATAGLRAHHRHHHHGGLAMFVALSLDTLGADDAKRPQIEKLQADLRDRMKPAREAERNLNKVVADGIAAGSLDQAKLDAAVAKVSSAAEAVHAATGDVLNKLHALLSPEERALLVDKVKAHAEVWRHVNHEAEPGGREHGGRLAELTKDLSLTPEQVEKIGAALKASAPGVRAHFRDQAMKRLEAFEAAFVADKFDSGALRAGSGDDGHFAAHGSKRLLHFYQTVLPLLTPEQRAKLADHLRERHGHKATPSK
jgi:Spy/CpxP family protein refolding chaperone